MGHAISLYNSLTEDKRAILFKIIEQIDTISNQLGLIDGSSTLDNCLLEPKLYLNSNDTFGELQDLFLAFAEEKDA